MFTSVLPAAGAVSSVVRNKGIKNAVSALELEKFKKLNLSLKQTNTDVFTKGVQLGQQYDIVKDASKEASKLSKMSKKMSKIEKQLEGASTRKAAKLTEKYTKLAQKSKLAQENFDTVETALKNGNLLSKEGEKIVSTAAHSAKTSFGKTAGTLFKSELKNKLVLGLTIAAAIPRVVEEVIPTFKEKGMIEGFKAAGKVAVRTAADFVSNAGISAVGRTIGATLGSVVPGIGNAIGGLLGDAIGSCISMRLTSKVFDKDETKTTSQNKEQTPTNTQNIAYSTQNSWSDDPNLNKRINRALNA